jgi:hypothetical protein
MTFYSPTKNDDQEIRLEKSKTIDENNWPAKTHEVVSKEYFISKSFFDILALREKLSLEGFPELDE